MKAMVMSHYGPPEDLRLMEVAQPEPKDNEVLVRVHATSVNDFDWALVRGKPYLYRLIFGIKRPKNQIPGMELAGVVGAVGKNVSEFKLGDRVYGDISEVGSGSFAEYICVDKKTLFSMSSAMTFEEAAALPHASMLALQGLVDIGNIQQGNKVLINGAGGGVGTLALQLAKMYNAEVTGVDTGDKLQMMRTIGFDHVIDYKLQDFTRNDKRYDLILDTKTTRSPSRYQKSLKEGGRYVTVGGHPLKLIQVFIAGKTYKRNMFVVALKQNANLTLINELFDNGKLKPIIDGPFKLEEAPQIIRYFGEGKHKGKVVLSVGGGDKVNE